MLAVSQYHTEAVLRHELAKFGVHVELRTEPVSMEQDADGVTVTIKKTDEVGGETTEKIRVPYVVGSDGARGKSAFFLSLSTWLSRAVTRHHEEGNRRDLRG